MFSVATTITQHSFGTRTNNNMKLHLPYMFTGLAHHNINCFHYQLVYQFHSTFRCSSLSHLRQSPTRISFPELRSIHLDLFRTRSSHMVTCRFHSACIRPVALGCFPVGSSLLTFGRFVSAGVRPCPRC